MVTQQACVLACALQTFFGDEAKWAVFFQTVCALAHIASLPEVVLCRLGVAHDAVLFGQLSEDHVPAAHAHDDQDQQGGFGYYITLCPKRGQTVGVVDDFFSVSAEAEQEGAECGSAAWEAVKQHRFSLGV